MIFSWAVIVPDTYKTTAFVNAVAVGQTIDIENLNNVLHQQNDRLPIDQNNGDSNASNNNKETVEGEIDSKQPSAADEIENEDENENENENRNDDNLELTQKNLKNHRMTDILVACFFFVAAIWLILATVYSVILLVLLRLQARGELDIYDENLGRLVLCNGRFTIHFGCILRRYAIQLEEVSIFYSKMILATEIVGVNESFLISVFLNFMVRCFNLSIGLPTAVTTTFWRF